MSVVIVNTQCANITSVKFAIERLGYKAYVSNQLHDISSAERVILPGVGTAAAAMKNIATLELATTLQHLQQPVLGICLGMQLLTEFSEEGNVNCLRLLNDRVKPMKSNNVRLPHMGWNRLTNTVSSPLFEGITQEDYFYFVHSYSVATGDNTLATCHYGEDFSAAIGKNNIMGVQFHPERSGKSGAKLLQNFMEMNSLT